MHLTLTKKEEEQITDVAELLENIKNELKPLYDGPLVVERHNPDIKQMAIGKEQPCQYIVEKNKPKFSQVELNYIFFVGETDHNKIALCLPDPKAEDIVMKHLTPFLEKHGLEYSMDREMELE